MALAAMSEAPAVPAGNDRCSPGLLAAGEAPPDQALRLRRIREICPGIEITRRGPWQAIIPEPDGERTVVRWDLAEFLDRLDALLVGRLPQARR